MVLVTPVTVSLTLQQNSLRTAALVVFAIAMLSGLYLKPDFGLPLAVWGLVWINLVRRLLGGTDAHVENDPLIAAPLIALLPVVLGKSPTDLKSRRGTVSGVQVLIVIVSVLTTLPIVQQGTVLGTLRSFAFFVLPLVAGIRLSQHGREQELQAASRAAMLAIPAASIYGLVQYIASPVWDLNWLRSVTVAGGAFGSPEPGAFRLFGPTSSPLAFATVLGVGILLWLNSDRNRIVKAAVISPMALALVLTSVRTGVFALAITIAIALILQRGLAALLPLALASTVALALIQLASLLNPILAQRFDVLGLGSDVSFQARTQLLTASPAQSIFSLGTGAGSSSNGSVVTDNGYLAAFIEYGFAGGSLLVALVFLVVGISGRRVGAG